MKASVLFCGLIATSLVLAGKAETEVVRYLLSGPRQISVAEDTSFADKRVEISGPAVTTSTGYLPPEGYGSVRFANVALSDVVSINGKFGIYVALTGVGWGPVEKTSARTADTALFQFQYVGKYSNGSGYWGYVDVTLKQDGADVVATATKWGNQSVKSAADANSQRGTYWEWTDRNSINNYKYTSAAYNYGVSLQDLSLTLGDKPATTLPIVRDGAATGTPTVTFGDVFCGSPITLADVNLKVVGTMTLGASQNLAGDVSFADGATLDYAAGFAFAAQTVRLEGDFNAAVALSEKPSSDLTLLENVAAGADVSRIRMTVNGIDVSSGLTLVNGVLTASKDTLSAAIVAGSLKEGELLWSELGDGTWSAANANWMSSNVVGIPWTPCSTAVFGYPGTQTTVTLDDPALVDALKITGDMDGLSFVSAAPTDALCFLRTGRARVSTAQDVSFADATLYVAGTVETDSTGYLPPVSSGLTKRFKNLSLRDIDTFVGNHDFSTAQSYSWPCVVTTPIEQTDTSIVLQYQWTKRYWNEENGGYEGYINVRFEQDGADVIAAAEKWSYRNYKQGEALERGSAWDFVMRDGITYYKYTENAPNPTQWQGLANLTLVLKNGDLAESVVFCKEGSAADVPVVTVGSGFLPNGLPVVLDGVVLKVGAGQSVRIGVNDFASLAGGPLTCDDGSCLKFMASNSEETGWRLGAFATDGLTLPETGTVSILISSDTRVKGEPPESAFVLTSGAGLSEADLPRFVCATGSGMKGYTAELGISNGELTVRLRKCGCILILR